MNAIVDDPELEFAHEVELTIPQTEMALIEKKYPQFGTLYPLFVAGYGSGKSTMLVVNVFNDLAVLTDVTVWVAVYAPTYDLLKLITIPYIEEFLIQMEVGYKLNKSDYMFVLETGDTIVMRSMDNPGRIIGYEVFRSHLDEIDTVPTNKAMDVWNKVLGRNRRKVPILNDDGEYERLKENVIDNDTGIVMAEKGDIAHYQNRVSCYTTPEGFGFAYQKWEDEPAPGYVKIKASTYSNIKNLPPDYIPSLRRSYPAELIEAYLNGEFVNLKGKRVYPAFSRIDNSTSRTVQSDDVLYVGMDFNVVTGASVIHVEEEIDGVVYIFAIDEIHNAYDTDEQIKILSERYPNHIINIYPDNTGDHRTSSNTTESDIAKLYNARLGKRKLSWHVHHNYSNPGIKNRVMAYNAKIKNGEGKIFYFVNIKKCPNLVNSLEQQIWNENGLPDKSTGLDHIVDAPGYYVYYKWPIVKPSAGTTTVFARY